MISQALSLRSRWYARHICLGLNDRFLALSGAAGRTSRAAAFIARIIFTKALQHQYQAEDAAPLGRGNIDVLHADPADFWLEDETVYEARNKGIGAAILVILVANRQGAIEHCKAEALEAMQASFAHLEGVEVTRPDVESFPEGGAPMQFNARHEAPQNPTPQIRLQRSPGMGQIWDQAYRWQ